MKQIATLGLSLACAIGIATTASAQTTSSSAGNLTTAMPSAAPAGAASASATTAAPRKPTSATAEMINEAIQRSQARAAKELETGRAQQWGSEEPFAYNPGVRNFNANQQ